MRRLRVVANEVEVVQGAEVAARDHPARLAVAGVEAALESELEGDAGPGDVMGDLDRRGDVRGERLLAERRESAIRRRPDQICVRGRRRGDDDRVGHVERGLQAGDGPGIDLRRRFRGSLRHRIGDDQLVEPRGRRQETGVQPTDPAGTEQGDPHRGAPSAMVVAEVAAAEGAGVAFVAPAPASRRRAAARTRRLIAALSAGGGQPLSCSTISQPA